MCAGKLSVFMIHVVLASGWCAKLGSQIEYFLWLSDGCMLIVNSQQAYRHYKYEFPNIFVRSHLRDIWWDNLLIMIYVLDFSIFFNENEWWDAMSILSMLEIVLCLCWWWMLLMQVHQIVLCDESNTEGVPLTTSIVQSLQRVELLANVQAPLHTLSSVIHRAHAVSHRAFRVVLGWCAKTSSL